MSGVATATSKSVPAALDALHQVVGADDVCSGSLGLAGFSPWANATTRCCRPVPAGRTAEPRTI